MELLLVVLLMVFAVAARHVEPTPRLQASLEKHNVCSNDHDNERSKLMQDISCGRPRDEFVHLVPEGSHMQVFPSAVWVKRCRGTCPGNNKECVATHTRELKIPVRILDAKSGESCATYTVEEHLQCGCQCTLNSTNCKPGYHLNHSKCKCQCNQVEGRRKCQAEKVKGNITDLWWNRSKCSCEKRR